MSIDKRIAVVALGVALACAAPGPPGRDDMRVLWKVPSGSPAQTPHQPVANASRSMVYFVTSDYRLRKIRGADGRVSWDVAVGSARRTPSGWNAVLAGGNVVVVKVDLFAFDTATGASRWTYVAPDSDETGYNAIVSDRNTVFAASRTARVYAIDASNGAPRWIVDLREGGGDVGALAPGLADGILYVCTRNVQASPLTGTLWALDTETGAVRWKHRFVPEFLRQTSRCFGYPAIWRDLVIQPQEDGRVFAFDRRTGAVRWIAPRAHDVSRSLGDARHAAAGDSIVVVTSRANEGMIVAYDPMTGAERWRHTKNAGSLYPPVIAGNTVYVDHGVVYAAYDGTTGAVLWQTEPSEQNPATIFAGPAIVAADRIFIAGRDGAYALARMTGR
jgi:outer membrane protein assembly factor BamB